MRGQSPLITPRKPKITGGKYATSIRGVKPSVEGGKASLSGLTFYPATG